MPYFDIAGETTFPYQFSGTSQLMKGKPGVALSLKLNYRALGVEVKNGISWFWLGTIIIYVVSYYKKLDNTANFVYYLGVRHVI